jgi:four helix bundle protein
MDMEDVFEYEDQFFEPAANYGEGRRSTNEDFSREMRRRTKSAAVQLVNFMRKAGKDPALNVIRYQILKSGTSVAANYRAACRARSKNEWYAKLCIVVEECDETLFWLELLMETEIAIDETVMRPIGKEYQTLLQIFAKARRSAKKNKSTRQ